MHSKAKWWYKIVWPNMGIEEIRDKNWLRCRYLSRRRLLCQNPFHFSTSLVPSPWRFLLLSVCCSALPVFAVAVVDPRTRMRRTSWKRTRQLRSLACNHRQELHQHPAWMNIWREATHLHRLQARFWQHKIRHQRSCSLGTFWPRAFERGHPLWIQEAEAPCLQERQAQRGEEAWHSPDTSDLSARTSRVV